MTILVKAMKLAPKTGPVLADIEGDWAQSFISTAVAYGIVRGYDASHFGPNDPVTREQITAMVVRAANLAPVSGPLSFTDSASIDPWARGYVTAAIDDGIVNSLKLFCSADAP
ncbi:MAG: S-layer homology domain-containing protein [Peptococcaceae bacterium]|nr:S-layer homology domain-containing protein [Peptococcaceae bacterium]